MNDGGTLNLAGFSDSVGAITINSGNTGGTITTGAGTLTTTGPVTSSGGSNASISGKLAMPAAGTITVTNATDELIVSAVVSGAATSLTKAGSGTLTLSGDNTYAGSTVISVGTLKLGATGGGANTPLGTNVGATSITAGAALDLNGFTLGTAEAVTILGTGISSGGALSNSSGSAASYSGLVTVGATGTSIVASGGDINLTHTGTIAGAGFALTLDGNANGSIASIIGTTTGTLTKIGTGNWNLTGANTYTGATTLNAGELRLSGATGANNGATAYTINSGATFTLDNSGTNLDARVANTSTFSMNGGEMVVIGNAAANTNETVGAFTLPVAAP